MPKRLLIEQVHLSFFLSNDAPQEMADAITKAFNHQGFLEALQAAVRFILDSNESLGTLSVKVDW